MKLLIKTLNPEGLKAEIISSIEKKKLETWSLHNENGEKYLKHTQQWGEKGVIKLTPNIIYKFLSVEVFPFTHYSGNASDFEGYYYGRFCEILFVNYPDKFTAIIVFPILCTKISAS